MRIDEAIKRYEASSDFLRTEKSTQTRYKQAFRHLKEFCKEYGVSDFRELKANRDAFMSYMKEREYAAGTIAKEVRIIRTLANYFGISLVEGAKSEQFRYTFSKQDKDNRIRKTEGRRLTHEEIESLKTYRWKNPLTNIRYHLAIRFLTETGARVSEVANIQVKDFDAKHATAWVDKSKTMPRKIYVSEGTAQMFRAYCQMVKPNPEDFIFPGKKRTLDWMIDKAMRELEIKSPGKRCHAFRHEYATRAIVVNKKSPQVVAHLMGIRVEMLMRVYVHRLDEVLEEEARSMF